VPLRFQDDFLKKLEYLHVVSKREFAGQNRADRRTPQRGRGIEFADHRPYTPGDDFRQIVAVRPRIGRPHVIHCLDRYQEQSVTDTAAAAGDFGTTIATHLRRTSLVPVISDFLFQDADRVVKELALLNAVHDVFLLMADVRFAYELPSLADGWVEAFDVETGRTRVLSRRELSKLANRVTEWQDRVAKQAREAGLDVVRVGLDRWEMETALVEFTAERRLRKTT